MIVHLSMKDKSKETPEIRKYLDFVEKKIDEDVTKAIVKFIALGSVTIPVVGG